jgi:hypothetical protein
MVLVLHILRFLVQSLQILCHWPIITKSFSGGDTVKDIVIGLAGGLTVPFALAAGISGAVAQTYLLVTAGFAEIAAGLDRHGPRRPLGR